MQRLARRAYVRALCGNLFANARRRVGREGEERRVDVYRQAIRLIASKPDGLRDGLSVNDATDILLVLFSAELYQALAVGRGWSHSRCIDFFREILSAQLVDAGE